MKPPVPVVITRPTAESEEFAARLNAVGVRTIVEPAMGILFAKPPLPEALRDISYLIVTSPRIVQVLQTHAIQSGVTLYVVGTKTAEDLRAAGYQNIGLCEPDVRSLLDRIKSQHAPATPLLYLRGQDIHTNIVGALTPHGFAVQEHICYEAVLTEQFSLELLKTLRDAHQAIITFFSTRTARHFCTLLDKAGISPGHLAIICISEHVKEACQHKNFKQIIVAERPDAAHMLQATQTLLAHLAAAPASSAPSEKVSSIAATAEKSKLFSFATAAVFMLVAISAGVVSSSYFSSLSQPDAWESATYEPSAGESSATPEVESAPTPVAAEASIESASHATTEQDALNAEKLVAEQRAMLDSINQRLESQQTLSNQAVEQYSKERDKALTDAMMWKCLALLEGELSEQILTYCMSSTQNPYVLELLRALEPIADSPILSEDDLRENFDALIPAALHMQEEENTTDKDWLEGAEQHLKSLVTIRKIGEIEGNTPQEIIARAEFNMQQGEIIKSVTELKALPASPKSVFSEWMAQAEATELYRKSLEKLRFTLTSFQE